MKSEKKYYIAAWLIAVAIFHVVIFLLPEEILSREENRFWIIYIGVLISFVGQAICSMLYASKEKKAERFLYLPVVLIGYIALLTTFLLAIQALLLQFLPDWFTIIVAVLVFGYYALAAIRTMAAADMIVTIDKKVEVQTAFIRTISSQANILTRIAPEELQQAVKTVYEALRYSDPMSSAELSLIEEDIAKEFDIFTAAVKGNEKVAAETAMQELVVLITQRNELCKQMK